MAGLLERRPARGTGSGLTGAAARLLGVRERHILVLLCAVCALLNYGDRVNVSVAIIAIGEQYGLDTDAQGLVLSAFFWGYIPSQLLAALLCRRHGAKRVLAAGALGWSAFTALTPLAAARGMPTLLLCRVGMGLAEGVAFPSVYHLFAAWIPSAERGKAMAVFHTGVHSGTTIALVLSPKIIAWHSWQMIFYTFGAAGGVWIVAWLLLARDTPDDAPVPPTPDGSKRPAGFVGALQARERRALAYIFRSRECMGICVTQFLMNFFHYTVLSWLPTYFREVFNVRTTRLWFTFIPYATMACTAVLGGILADGVAAKTGSLLTARRLVTTLSCGGTGAMIALFASTTAIPHAIAAISAALAFFSLNCGGYEASFLDVAEPQYAGLLKSVANTLGATSGALAVAIAAKLFKWSGSWRFVFAAQSAWCFAAGMMFSRYGSAECVLTEARFAGEEERREEK